MSILTLTRIATVTLSLAIGLARMPAQAQQSSPDAAKKQQLQEIYTGYLQE